jgi:Plasmid pRiA4b ORF-3-like protein
MNSIYQIKCKLLHTKPAVYRTILVDSNTNFYELHHIVQLSMGWGNYHLFNFRYHDYWLELPNEEDETDNGFSRFQKIDPRAIALKEFFISPKSKIIYTYDFGDSWNHEIQLQKILAPDSSIAVPYCLKGKYACPPEDCGSIPGYYNIIEIMKNPKHREYKEYLEWLNGEPYNMEEFDINLVNENLKDLKEYIHEWEDDQFDEKGRLKF